MRNPSDNVSTHQPLLTTAQAAALLNLHPVSLRTARSKKKLNLPYVRVGGAIRYRREDIEAFIATNREGGS